jgi:hypothetical protein
MPPWRLPRRGVIGVPLPNYHALALHRHHLRELLGFGFPFPARRQDMFRIFKAAKEQLQQAKLAQVVNFQQAKQARGELTVALEAIGINFMKMNPIIHNALLKEALATSTEEAMAHFIAALDALKTSSASHDAKARGLRAFYAYRARQFSD